MREAAPDCSVSDAGWRALVNGLPLPDADDRRVLAAVIAGHADCIVTLNPKDFPVSVLASFGIEVIDPDTFLIKQWDWDPVNAIAAFKFMRARRKKPQSSPEDFADALELGGLPIRTKRLHAAAELI
ncbi:MAG: hypothetical protein ACOYB1_10595 [Limnohabitans sp.]